MSLLIVQKLRMDWQTHLAHMPEREAYEGVILKMGQDLAPPPPVTMAALARHQSALVQAERRVCLQAELSTLQDELASLPQVGEAIEARRQYDAAQRAYLTAQKAVLAYEAAAPAWQASLDALADIAQRVEDCHALIVQVEIYDHLEVVFKDAVQVYETQRLRIQTLEAERDEYAHARAALAEVKHRVKTYLVPSLSRVASLILHRMTAGRLTQIEVDEDFEITVGGVAIDGLSGAGKAAANLALRIGLGQVLTNKVFSVFMADEIDAAMDADNAQATADALRNLTGQIQQIILVSHKTPEADQYIRLG